MAGASLTEGEARANGGSVSSPSVTYDDASPLAGEDHEGLPLVTRAAIA